MEAVADLGFLQIAEIGVEFAEIVVVLSGEARIEIESAAAGEVEVLKFMLPRDRCRASRGSVNSNSGRRVSPR